MDPRSITNKEKTQDEPPRSLVLVFLSWHHIKEAAQVPTKGHYSMYKIVGDGIFSLHYMLHIFLCCCLWF